MPTLLKLPPSLRFVFRVRTASAVLLAFFLLAVSLGSLFLVGLPVAWLLKGCRPLTQEDWVVAPFLGLAGISLPLLNLVYLDVPVRRSAPWFWLAVLALYAAWAAHGGLLVSLRQAPGPLLLACLLVYLFQAGAMLCCGAEEYLGRAKGDMFNYNAIAHFMAEQPRSTSFQDVGRQPWSYLGVYHKPDRPGAQSVVQALAAVSTARPCDELFTPTILLGSALTALAVWPLARSLGVVEKHALIAVLLAGVLPAVTWLLVEAFLSQALALPFLLFLPAAAQTLIDRPGAGRLVRLVLLFTTGTLMYPEFMLIFTGLLGVQFAAAVALRLMPWHRAILWLALLLVALPLLAPGSLPAFAIPFIRLDSTQGQKAFQAAQPFLPLYVWRGDTPFPIIRHDWVLLWCTRLLVACVAGLVLGGIVSWRRRGRQGRPAAVVVLVMLALLAQPVAVWVLWPHRTYQIHKLVMSVAPALVLGLALWPELVPPFFPRALWRLGCRGLAVGVLLVAVWGTFLQLRETVVNEVRLSSYAPPCLDGAARTGRRWLSGEAASDWILSAGHTDDDCSRVALWCRDGCHHRIWMTWPRLHFHWLHKPTGEMLFADLETAPATVNYLIGGRNGYIVRTPGQAELRASADGLNWWVLREGRWCVPIAVRDDQGHDFPARERPLPAGRHWSMEVVAHCAGEVEISALWGCPEVRGARLTVQGPGHESLRAVTPGDITARIPIPEGRHMLRFTLQPESPGKALSGVFPLGAVAFSFTPRN